MRRSILVFAWCLSGCDGRGADVGTPGDVHAATTPVPRAAPEPVAAAPRDLLESGSLRLYVVAKRGDPLVLEVDESMELLRASFEIVELRGEGPLTRDPKVLVGMRELFVDDEGDGSGVYRLAARWPHFAILTEDLRSRGRGISARSVLWDGGGWRRDDIHDGDSRRVHVPMHRCQALARGEGSDPSPSRDADHVAEGGV